MSLETPMVFLMLLGGALLGSWHCAGMCGPIIAALGQGSQKILSYHLGRGLSYIGAGALAGWLGRQGLEAPPLSLRILAGLTLGGLLLFSFMGNSDTAWSRSWARKVFGWMKRSPGGLWAGGFLSVLLPCGWLWSYLAAAAATGSATAGALVLAALWLGSLPALAMIGGYLRRAVPAAPPKTRRWAGVILSVAGFYSLLSHFFLS